MIIKSGFENYFGVRFFCQTAKSEKDTFYLQKEEPARSYVMALGNLILAVDNQIYKIKRYEIYCFCFGKIRLATCG